MAVPVLLAGCGRPEPQADSPVGITYVDNDCFLIISDGHKILIDAHAMLPSGLRTSMEQATPPFDELDLILTTHAHSDHFEPHLVGTLLEQHPDAILVSTDEVAGELDARLSNYAELKDRVQAFTPEEGERVQVSAGGVDLEVLNLPHDWPVTNLGFIINIGGKRLLHTGDTFPPHLRSYSFPEDNLDVAFVPYFFLTEQQYLEEGKSVIVGAIQAEQLVPMHHSPSQPGLEEEFEAIATNHPQAILFYEAMQTHVIE
jgi:L-ascorbate metabolism protein UlaG (beta-lactamase superfamily)